jgi:predicted glycosyltransferase
MADAALPSLLFYCQHSLGIGHLTRSFALAQALRAQFRVVFLNGGRLPAGVSVPTGVACIQLPPLGLDEGHALVCRDEAHDLATAWAERHRLIQEAVAATRPALLLVELFPFGRKKFAAEILPMIRAVRRQGGRVACSLRDILVGGRRDQQRFDDRASWLANRYFDLVLVHSDPAFARLEESFRPLRPLRAPVQHTGFVVPERRVGAAGERGEHVVVSAGGGIVGHALFRAALQAHRLTGLAMQVVAGPFLPEAQWQALQHEAAAWPGVRLVRQVPDLAAVLGTARASVSQCGYNTALDLIVSQVPALVVPYTAAGENEQRQRALRLAALGAVQCLEADPLDGEALVAALPELLRFRPRPAALALDGARRSAELLAQLVDPSRGHPVAEELACSAS